jgi:hypothetical protein
MQVPIPSAEVPVAQKEARISSTRVPFAQNRVLISPAQLPVGTTAAAPRAVRHEMFIDPGLLFEFKP